MPTAADTATGFRPLTEREWLHSTDLRQVGGYAARSPGPRTRLLFACACCRVIHWYLLPGELRRALGVAERVADGLADDGERAAAVGVAWAYYQEQQRRGGGRPPGLGNPAVRAAYAVALALRGEGLPAAHEAERRLQCEAYREIFGNGFRPAFLRHAWLTWSGCCVARLARSIYDGADFAAMPVLADALEEAGCTDESMLHHGRRPGSHVKGCWLLDLLLGQR